MDRNTKLLWGVIGFAVLMGFVLPSPDGPASDRPDAAELQPPPQEPAAVPPPRAPMVDMTAEMPTDFTIDAQPTFSGSPGGIDGSPTSFDASTPAPSPPPAPQPLAPPQALAGAPVAGNVDVGPPLNPTQLR
ncbi:hypothetical protein [Novosphingopyxis sp.]|uniref:hypothetical protein n=1 Tax=Novosphingopyxis sp. TaxID=2709690 RepID=UPI003B5AA110